jgi:hypothetical protein
VKAVSNLDNARIDESEQAMRATLVAFVRKEEKDSENPRTMQNLCENTAREAAKTEIESPWLDGSHLTRNVIIFYLTFRQKQALAVVVCSVQQNGDGWQSMPINSDRGETRLCSRIRKIATCDPRRIS